MRSRKRARTATCPRTRNITPPRSSRARTRRDIEDKLSRAQIIDPTELSGDKIVFGATVTLLDEDDKPIRYQIVGETEADASKGRISFNSPIGRALIGRKVDDEVEVTVPSGDRYYLVSKIEFV